MTLKTAAFVPMPKASTRMVTTLNPGLFRNCRYAYRKSWESQSSMLTIIIIQDARTDAGVDSGNAPDFSKHA